MGLLGDIFGNTQAPQGGAQQGGGMSPMMLAVLALLAYKALKSGPSTSTSPAPPSPVPSSPAPSGGGLGDILGGMLKNSGGLGGSLGGSLGDILKGPLGSVLAGGAAGGALSGGLNDILKQLQANGHGEVANSWVGDGPNKPISPKDLEDSLGHDTMKSLAEQAGLSQVQLMSGLSQGLPNVVDKLTPQGRVPTADEASRLL